MTGSSFKSDVNSTAMSQLATSVAAASGPTSAFPPRRKRRQAASRPMAFSRNVSTLVAVLREGLLRETAVACAKDLDHDVVDPEGPLKIRSDSRS